MSYTNEDTWKQKDKMIQDALKETKAGIQRCDYKDGKPYNEMVSNNMGSGTYPTDTKYAAINQVGANEPTEMQGFGDGTISDCMDNPAPNSQMKTRKQEMAEPKPDVGSEKSE